ncbi:VOC family protein [Mesorhizobium sp. CAU 1741]|uniref:VOC family protein n=1 Tax=Mesorhizobium sp. CAU 1741 TaxID=3140366 RepID=UPI00325ABC4F
MQINPYLSFDGRCREAFEFYARVLQGEIVMISTFGEMPDEMQVGDEWKDRIVHVTLVANGQTLMGSDAPSPHFTKPQGFSVTLTTDTSSEAERLYGALIEGGTVFMEMQETVWAERFAMFADRFGTPWMISCNKPL